MDSKDNREGMQGVEEVSISVRELVEFIMRSGDLDNRSSKNDPEVMQEGIRIHKKLQRQMGGDYKAEVPLCITIPVDKDGQGFLLKLDGRADGIFTKRCDETDTELMIFFENAACGEASQDMISDISESMTAMAGLDADIFGDVTAVAEGHSESGILVEKTAIAEPDMSMPLSGTAFVAKHGTDIEIPPEITVIDEIKSVYQNLQHIEFPYKVHLAQAKCYAYIYAVQNNLDYIGIQMTYCNIESEQVKRFEEYYEARQLAQWFDALTKEYCKWAAWKINWRTKRNESIKRLQFPFEYRPGQKDLVANVYRTIIRSRKIFIEAPTGVGKTISTVFPAVKAMGEGKADKLFYLTAKTITRTVAEETFQILNSKGMRTILVTLTAKEKICVLGKPDCNPMTCERAKGHYDRVNGAVFDMLENEESVTRSIIEAYAEKHRVCPFEMCLDVTLWADAVICDYNYVFDPNVYLRRFFADEKQKDFLFLIDEAHNLVDRGREMFSAELFKEDFLKCKRYLVNPADSLKLAENGNSSLMLNEAGDGSVGGSDTGQLAIAELSTAPVKKKRRGEQLGTVTENLVKQLEASNRAMLAYKRECDECEVWDGIDDLVGRLERLSTAFEEYFSDEYRNPNKEELLLFFLDVRHFMNMYANMDENYMIYSDYAENGDFRMKLLCLDPSENLKRCLQRGKSAVFFSATLLPIKYYKEQLGGTAEDYAVYAPSPFDTANRLIMIARDVSMKYTRRSESEYRKIVRYIKTFTEAKVGNYMVFFPSYQTMNSVAELADSEGLQGVLLQQSSMTEQEREDFLAAFMKEPDSTLVGFCVMGGIFSEGIDLKSDRLIGAVIVGTGLPMVCNERELFRGFYDRRSGAGFDYSYLYAGMNKVLQSAGRVIRTTEDRGCILLLDERFSQQQYTELFPYEWYPYCTVNEDGMKELLDKFWR